MKYAPPRPLLAVDPGLNSLGWAYWSYIQMVNRGTVSIPTRVGLLHAPRKMELAARAWWLSAKLEEEITEMGRFGSGGDIVCEYPAYHGSIRGWATGDLQKLTFLVGVIAGYFHRARFTPITPNQWKGQLPKNVVIRRLQKKFGPGATQHWEKDVWDAVGIGLFHQGKF